MQNSLGWSDHARHARGWHDGVRGVPDHLASAPVESQGFGKKGMIAVPLTLTIQGYDKEIGLLESFKYPLAVNLLYNSITERGSEPFEDTRREQKGLYLLRLLLEHLLD